MKLTEIKGGKFSTETYVVKQNNEHSEVFVIENDAESKLMKLMFLTHNSLYPIGAQIWLPYSEAEKFDIIKKSRIDIPGGDVPIFS